MENNLKLNYDIFLEGGRPSLNFMKIKIFPNQNENMIFKFLKYSSFMWYNFFPQNIRQKY